MRRGPLVLGIIGGLALFALSFPFASTWQEWIFATSINAGVALLLAVPIALFLKHLEEDVQSVDRRVEEFRATVNSAKEETAAERARRIADQVVDQKEGVRSKIATGTLSTSGEIIAAVRVAASDALISGYYGLEVVDPVSGGRFRFAPPTTLVNYPIDDWSSGTIRLEMRRFGAHPWVYVDLHAWSDLGEAAGRLLALARVDMQVDYEPLVPFELLMSDLRKVASMADQNPRVRAVQRVISPDWVMQDGGLLHLPSGKSVPLMHLRATKIAALREEAWTNLVGAHEAIKSVKDKLGQP